MKNKTLKFVVMLFLVAAFSTVTLTLVNQVTEGKIAEQKEAAFKDYFSDVYKTDGAEKVEDLDYVYDGMGYAEVEQKFDFGTKGEAFLVTANGRNGDVTVFIALGSDGAVLDVILHDHSETAGYWEGALNPYKAQVALTPTHYSYFADIATADIGATGSTLTASAIRNAFRGLYFYKEDNK